MPTTSYSSPARPRRRLVALAVLVVAAVGAGAAILALRGPDAEIGFEGPSDDAVVNAAALEELAFVATTDTPGTLEDTEVRLDGEDVTDEAELDEGSLTYAPRQLDDGDHEVEMAVPGRAGSASERWAISTTSSMPTRARSPA